MSMAKSLNLPSCLMRQSVKPVFAIGLHGSVSRKNCQGHSASSWRRRRADGRRGFGDYTDNLRTIALVFYSYESSHGSLPASRKNMINGHPVSWRVLIPPFLGQEGSKLFSKYRVEEPWDSQHNLSEVAPHMPAGYEFGTRPHRIGQESYGSITLSN